ncbi:MAG: hypothetical protein L0K82_02050 [Pisciglobus halotolerans]|nr:hypothetical protein [Pisciglobus halotolerans]
MSRLMNRFHDTIQSFAGASLSDKELHFYIIGIIGMATFFALFLLIKVIRRVKFSTTILSFLFTFVLMVVFVFAIEIQQAVTQSGNMEFADIVSGLWGFVLFFSVYNIGAALFYGVFRMLRYRKRQHGSGYSNKRSENSNVKTKTVISSDRGEFTETEVESLNYRSKRKHSK